LALHLPVCVLQERGDRFCLCKLLTKTWLVVSGQQTHGQEQVLVLHMAPAFQRAKPGYL
jgi:hypothetical protein